MSSTSTPTNSSIASPGSPVDTRAAAVAPISISTDKTNESLEDDQIRESFASFQFNPNSSSSLNTNEKILEQLPASGSSTGLTTPAFANCRRLSIGTKAVIPTLLNAQLNNFNLFDFDHEPKQSKPGFENGALDPNKICLENKLSTLSTALMTKRQLGKIISGIRDLEQTLNRVNIRSKVTHVMVVTKLHDPEPIQWAHKVSRFLLEYSSELKIYIQDKLQENPSFQYDALLDSHETAKSRIRLWQADRCSYRPELFDLIMTFGGDGTVLYASWLFQSVIPPVLPFALGSLGFLTDFNVGEHKEILSSIIENGYQCSIRMRFECTIMKSRHNNDPNADLKEEVRKLGFDTDTHDIFETFTVFNEVVVDRGPNAMMTTLEMFGDRDPLTTAEADGLIISTPSGSTAYSLSAGGSLVHPEIPGILISPICPHTLSFRPLVIPESIILRLGVPYDARVTAWCSFDGKNRVELDRGDFITITASRFPLPCIRKPGSRNIWFERLSSTLHWNERKPQKPLGDPLQFP
jgi:NAD+ kinase